MAKILLGVVEARFADIVWENAPLTTRKLIDLCAEALNWKRTTTYTVLKKLCERGIFNMADSLVTVVIPKDEFYAMQCEQFVEATYHGSLPAFIAAFTSRKAPTREELEQIKSMIKAYEENELG